MSSFEGERCVKLASRPLDTVESTCMPLPNSPDIDGTTGWQLPDTLASFTALNVFTMSPNECLRCLRSIRHSGEGLLQTPPIGTTRAPLTWLGSWLDIF